MCHMRKSVVPLTHTDTPTHRIVDIQATSQSYLLECVLLPTHRIVDIQATSQSYLLECVLLPTHRIVDIQATSKRIDRFAGKTLNPKP